jgi:hypothetical protein
MRDSLDDQFQFIQAFECLVDFDHHEFRFVTGRI